MAGRPKGLPKTGGRKAGGLNKSSASVKECIEKVYELIGGDAAFSDWAVREPTEFYKIYAKLIPRDINATVSGALTINVINEF